MLLPTAFRLILVVWLVYVALYDRRTWTVPWWTTWPVILATCLGFAVRGAWSPALLFVVCFLWDSTVGDLKRLARRPVHSPEADDRRWLLPDLAAWGLTFVLLAAAHRQGETAFVFTAGYALVHLLWRLGWLPGGDAAFFIALIGLFPRQAFLWLAGIVVGTTALLLLLWRRRHIWLQVLRTGLTAGPWAALRTVATFSTEPEPVAWLFSLAGLVAIVRL